MKRESSKKRKKCVKSFPVQSVRYIFYDIWDINIRGRKREEEKERERESAPKFLLHQFSGNTRAQLSN